MKHDYETSADHPNCSDPYCWVCQGGLSICKTCGLYEGSLTTDCPGVPSYSEQADAVYAGQRDYRNGQWVEAPSPHCPAGIRAYAASLGEE